MWLLAKDVDPVLHGKTFTRYILKDEITNNTHPGTSGIMYVSLTKLSEESNPAGELAAFLLGKIADPQNDDVKKIAAAFNSSFDTFKADKEVVRMLSLADRYRHDGIVEGVAIGEARGKAKGKAQGVNIGIDRMLELIQNGLSPEEAIRKIREDKNWLKELQLED